MTGVLDMAIRPGPCRAPAHDASKKKGLARIARALPPKERLEEAKTAL